MNKYTLQHVKLRVIYACCRCSFSSYSSSHSKSISIIKMLRFMGLCIVKHKVKTNNGNSFRKKSIMIQKILEQRRSACVLRFVHYSYVQPWSLINCTCGRSGGMLMISNGQQCSDFPSLRCQISFIQLPSFKLFAHYIVLVPQLHALEKSYQWVVLSIQEQNMYTWKLQGKR